MHDPMVEVFTIPRPWPKRGTRGKTAKSGKPLYHRRFWFDGLLPDLIVVWHVDPGKDGDEDSCHAWRHSDSKAWRLYAHVHHWEVVFVPWRKLKRWLFTRCYVCGKRLPYGYAPIKDRWLPENKKQKLTDGEFGVCHFPDDARCDAEAARAWRFYREHLSESRRIESELRL